MNQCDACTNPNSVSEHNCDELGPQMLVGQYSEWDNRSGGDVPILVKIQPEELTVSKLLLLVRAIDGMPHQLLGEVCRRIESLLETKMLDVEVGEVSCGS